MIDTTKLSNYTMSPIVQNNGAPDDITRMDDDEREEHIGLISQMTAKQAFICYCTWNGLLGWGSTLWDVMHELEGAEK